MGKNDKSNTPQDNMGEMLRVIGANSGFDVSQKAQPIIKVVGVGGGGSNAVNHMYAQNIQGVSFVVINTDRQALEYSPVPNRLLIGPETTCGLGAGDEPECARLAAEESAEDIGRLFEDSTKMVFITAGMGGGTGTGAAPVVARIAREHGVLTIGIVTIPFLFEGKNKILKALAGAEEMKKYVDAQLVINNERLSEVYPDLDFQNAFGKADDTLSVAAQSISDIITVNGYVNLDFKDVNTTLRDGGVAIISSGYGEGENRVTKAINDALESPLLKNRNVYGSKRVLFNFSFSPESQVPFKTAEIREMNDFMLDFDEEVKVIWGAAYDKSLGDRIKVTILASGFAENLSIEDEAPEIMNMGKGRRTQKIDEGKTLRENYGSTVEEQEIVRQTRNYYVFGLDEMDDDEVIGQVEQAPAYKRDPKLKAQLKARKHAEPAPEPQRTAQAQSQSGTAGSIMFS